jgi:hypothetical protein
VKAATSYPTGARRRPAAAEVPRSCAQPLSLAVGAEGALPCGAPMGGAGDLRALGGSCTPAAGAAVPRPESAAGLGNRRVSDRAAISEHFQAAPVALPSPATKRRRPPINFTPARLLAGAGA